MKAIVNKPLNHMFMGILLEPGTELVVEDEVTPRGMVQIISPMKYSEMYISTKDIDFVKEAPHE
ncbi:hypothetical protein D3C74_473880 [compost metagenome]